jgi:hypothetical protein
MSQPSVGTWTVHAGYRRSTTVWSFQTRSNSLARPQDCNPHVQCLEVHQVPVRIRSSRSAGSAPCPTLTPGRASPARPVPFDAPGAAFARPRRPSALPPLRQLHKGRQGGTWLRIHLKQNIKIVLERDRGASDSRITLELMMQLEICCSPGSAWPIQPLWGYDSAFVCVPIKVSNWRSPQERFTKGRTFCRPFSILPLGHLFQPPC